MRNNTHVHTQTSTTTTISTTVPTPVVPAALWELLSTPRGEPKRTRAFMRHWLPQTMGVPQSVLNEDEWGNFWLHVTSEGKLQKTRGEVVGGLLWAAHHDTVDSEDVVLQKELEYTEGILRLIPKPHLQPAPSTTPATPTITSRLSLWGSRECLGADDGAGVWLLTEMVRARVPGTYIWFAEEESGCKGSSAWRKSQPQLVSSLRAVISLDRGGTGDIVSTQMGEPCVSKEFLELLRGPEFLGDLLPLDGQGSYTDSHVFMDCTIRGTVDKLVECTNLSIGYTSQHSPQETLSMWHLTELRDKLVGFVGLARAIEQMTPTRVSVAWDWWDYGWNYGKNSTKKAQASSVDNLLWFFLESDLEDVAKEALEEAVDSLGLRADYENYLQLHTDYEEEDLGWLDRSTRSY